LYKRWVFPRLIAISGPLAGATLPLADDEVSVGRDPENLIALADPAVSAQHCVLARSTGGLELRDLDPANPSFVNSLPADNLSLADGDQIQIGRSLFILRDADTEVVARGHMVSVIQTATVAPLSLVLSREDVFAGNLARQDTRSARIARDLEALIRISAAINGIRGLVALERPLLELIADVIPVNRGAILLSGDGSTDIVSRSGWSDLTGADEAVQVSRPLIDHVLRDVVGILSFQARDDGAIGGRDGVARSVIAAPLVAFDKRLGVIVIEKDGPHEPLDDGHLRLLMAIAGIAATALQHARQVESLEGAQRLLIAEMNLDHNMVGDSAPMREVYRRIARVARTDATALITGESGTGKELVARAIHRNSSRAAKPFVAINAAAITETLLESELFGHEKGAFTGAVVQKKGKLETAQGGTVFLDEIGELSMPLQSKLLRVLENHQFDRVGGTTCVHVDFRLIAATNLDLDQAIAAGTFRRDLYYRLNVVSLALPALRERRSDIPLLANWFVRRHADKAKRSVTGFSDDAMACLMSYEWPGNVRELENAVEHAVVLGFDTRILRDDLPEAIAEAAASPAPGRTAHFHDAVMQAKKDLIVRAMEAARGNHTAAAKLLGLHPNYLHRLIKNLQLKPTLKHFS
jgi:two-component system, NtrC family, response regulator HydG